MPVIKGLEGTFDTVAIENSLIRSKYDLSVTF